MVPDIVSQLMVQQAVGMDRVMEPGPVLMEQRVGLILMATPAALMPRVITASAIPMALPRVMTPKATGPGMGLMAQQPPIMWMALVTGPVQTALPPAGTQRVTGSGPALMAVMVAGIQKAIAIGRILMAPAVFIPLTDHGQLGMPRAMVSGPTLMVVLAVGVLTAPWNTHSPTAPAVPIMPMALAPGWMDRVIPQPGHLMAQPLGTVPMAVAVTTM